VSLGKPHLRHIDVKKSLWSSEEPDERIVSVAIRLYWKACALGWLGKVWALFTRREYRLIDLKTIKAKKPVFGWRYLGVQDIQIDQIVGSEKWCNDFDKAFNPVQYHDKARWLTVATNRLRGIYEPPVELVQVGSQFFAQSGQYQISVARAMGEKVIKAYVTRWDVFNRSGKDFIKNEYAKFPIFVPHDAIDDGRWRKGNKSEIP